MKFIEIRWNLAPLGTRDAAANDLSNAFDFTQTAGVPLLPVTGGDFANRDQREVEATHAVLVITAGVVLFVLSRLCRRRARST